MYYFISRYCAGFKTAVCTPLHLGRCYFVQTKYLQQIVRPEEDTSLLG